MTTDPEYAGHTLFAWAKRRGVLLDFIQPGKPQQNADVERYNRTVRYDWLSQSLFATIAEVQAADTEMAKCSEASHHLLRHVLVINRVDSTAQERVIHTGGHHA